MDNQTTVLAIDDFEPVLTYLQTALEIGGHRVVAAANGRQGLEVFELETPDIILVDLQMPDMGGLEFIAEIRKSNDSVPIIVISGQSSLTDAIEATRCGAWDYLTKPINRNELDFSIRRCLERARLLRENHNYSKHLELLVRAQTVEIEENKARYRRLLESVTNYVYTVTVRDGVPVETIHRPGCERITGRTLEEFNADPGLWRRIIHEDDRLLVFGLSQHILADPGNRTMEHRILHKDGSIRWVTNTLVPCRNMQATLMNNGAPGALLLSYDCIITDITQRKTTEEQLKRHMGNMTSLRTIDKAINSAIDLRITLNVFLNETLDRLNVDAACILLLDSAGHTLEYVLGKGFFTDHIYSSRLHLGECYAGRAAKQRTALVVADISSGKDANSSCPVIEQEGFMAFVGVPLITKGQVKGVLGLYHRKFLKPEREWLEFAEVLAGQAAIAIDNAEMFDNLLRSNNELLLAYDSTIEGWSRALDHRDKETEGHSRRVTELTVNIAGAMGFDREKLLHIRRGALLHDIGKLGVPDSILLKPAPLTDDEFATMKRHPEIAFSILSPIEFLRPALDIPYCHHEKWDGCGYPRGLKGDEIPLSARIFAVVDVWDALRSDRPYRPAWSAAKALEHIFSLSGSHFDPAVLKVFGKTFGV
ncbi:MAG: response regulator [Deltaproteobacteria bacterium]|nr:response regulator [Deltaproteobacteria bacterium]